MNGPAATDDAALDAIAAFKLTKASLQLVGFGVLVVAALFGLTAALPGLLGRMVEELPLLGAEEGARAAATLEREVTPERIGWAIALLGLDGCSTLAEGIGLRRRRPWAPWLVVAATGTFLPPQLWGFFGAPGLLRALGIAVNLVVVGYLASRIVRERRAALLVQGGSP